MSRIGIALLCLTVTLAALACIDPEDASNGQTLGQTGEMELAMYFDGVPVEVFDLEISYAIDATSVFQREFGLGDTAPTLSLSLPVGSYVAEATAFDAAVDGREVGSGVAFFEVTAGELTLVDLIITLDGHQETGDGALEISFAAAPRIQSTSVFPMSGGAELSIDAIAPSGGELEIAWGGYGVGTDPVLGSAIFVDESLGEIPGAEYDLTIAAVQDLTNGTSTTVTFFPSGGCYSCGPVSTAINEMADGGCLAECKAQWDSDKRACDAAFPDNAGDRWLCHTAAFAVYLDCIVGCSEAL